MCYARTKYYHIIVFNNNGVITYKIIYCLNY